MSRELYIDKGDRDLTFSGYDELERPRGKMLVEALQQVKDATSGEYVLIELTRKEVEGIVDYLENWLFEDDQ